MLDPTTVYDLRTVQHMEHVSTGISQLPLTDADHAVIMPAKQ